jgi:hypothetical protein
MRAASTLGCVTDALSSRSASVPLWTTATAVTASGRFWCLSGSEHAGRRLTVVVCNVAQHG